MNLKRTAAITLIFLAGAGVPAQETYPQKFLPDSVFGTASLTITVMDISTGEVIFSIDPERTLTPASVQKLVTTSAALRLLGPGYTFRTITGWSGQRNRSGETLTGDIIIRGGGDPSLGSEEFTAHYGSIIDTIVNAIRESGIRKIKGRIVADDRIYDFNPVPARWVWEDLGNYYGAGAYGISVFDNTFRIIMKTGNRGTPPDILRTEPDKTGLVITSYLVSEGATDRGYVWSAPYGKHAWITGSVPENREEFILKASVPDPPMMLATMVRERLLSEGFEISGEAVTARTLSDFTDSGFTSLSVISSPPLAEIVKVLNHESINLFAEHLVKQMGFEATGLGTAEAGLTVIRNYIETSGLPWPGIFIEDGSGVAPLNALNSIFVASLVRSMVNDPMFAATFRDLLPKAGAEGTMKSYFRDPLFTGHLRAKTGSMTRVRSFAGLFTGNSGREFAFCVMVNNYTGTPATVIRHVEELMQYLIINY
jgi:D-alanyl-D-alanine carboxypeptidase/D-alanyl-D-alanine-endopeptidase (penicillin-binding protein 4)